MNDIFEKIIRKEIPAEIVYEDDFVIAFLDNAPLNLGHTLIIPKKKFVNIFDADTEIFGHMAKVAQKIAIALREVTHADGVNLTMNNEPAAGQKVFHAHMHVIPRFENDGVYKPAVHKSFTDGEIESMADSLRATLN